MEEEGSDIADEVWSRASSRIASRLGYPEARAALATARRARRIDERAHRGAVKDLDAACAAMRLVLITWDRDLARAALDAGRSVIPRQA